MNPLTLAELRLRQAQLAEKAERLRQEWRALTPSGTRSLSAGKRVTQLQHRADDYAELIRLAESGKAPS